MSKHADPKSPPPVTYTAREPIHGPTLTCGRCKRVYAFPEPNGVPIRCECGWRYENHGGEIREEFRSRIGI